MFTGIIEATAAILKTADSSLFIERPVSFDDLKIGSSIAISGVCLSVTWFDQLSMSFDVIPTTLRKTKLGSLKPGDRVNLERALPASGRFDGHIVLGHCEATGAVLEKIEKKEAGGDHWQLDIEIPEKLRKYIIPHGSIAIDGVSLTIAGANADAFSIALIPHTLEHTTIGRLAVGDKVNIETDILGRYVLQGKTT